MIYFLKTFLTILKPIFSQVKMENVLGLAQLHNAYGVLKLKHFFNYKMWRDGWKTIVSNGDFDKINNRAFKLPRLANFYLHQMLTKFDF